MKKTWKKIPILFLSLCMLCASFPLIIQSVQAQEQIMITSEPESKEIQIVSLYSQITVQSGQLMPDTCEIVENDIYGYIVDYSLKKGHTLSVSGDDYVFSVRAYQDGNYNTMLKSATSASFTATEDVTVGMLIRKTDKSALTEQDFAAITIYDSQYGMIDVEGYAHRFTVEAETIEGNTVTTRANIFLPESYSEDGDATPLIIMTNGYSAHLTDSTWNGNTAENIGVVKTYLEAGYAVLVVNNTANHTSQTPDLGCPQLVDSYLKAHAYVTENLNVEENFSIHARSFGTFAGVRLMREVPELIKCAVMTGSRVSFAYEWRGLDKAFIANRFGFEDATGTTYEANKLIGYDPYADVDAEEYQLPPTFWMLAEGDATERPLTYIGKLKEHGNDVLQKTYAEISHTGICTLNSEQSAADALAFLEKYQSIEGKTISILGDSISTYAGVSNDSTINATLAGGAIYYTPGKQDIYREDTWWQQTIDALGMELLVNNSWSGSCVFPTRSGTAGAYVNRCVQLHNDKTGQEPDVIAVFLGTNDFSYYQSALGSFDAIDFDTLIVQNEDGTYTYATPTTSCEAYAIMLHKMTVRYPDAEVYCLGMLARRGTAAQPTAFNASLKQIATLFGCTYVELESLISTDPAEFDKYLTDARVHPGPLGMDLMTKALASEMLGRDVALNNVSYHLLNVSADRRITTVLENDALCIKLTEGAGCENLHVNVQMDGVDVTDQYYANGVVSIPCVSGDVVIIATADRQLSHFGWKFDGEELIPFTEQENALTRKSGNTTNGALMNTYYQLQTPILLNSDQPWTVAWKASGNIWSGMMLSENATSNANGNRYVFKTNGTNGFIGFGESVSGTYHNYGIALVALGVDVTAEHVYRLENRIAADGSNMVYLYVDGTCMGAMNHYYIGGSSDQKQTVDWLNGKSFTFSHIGASAHALNNCKLEYFMAWEAGHTHTYTTVTTTPTCTEQGYTTHICACGDSFVDSYVDATGHTWSGAKCSICDVAHPNAVNYEGKVISILGDSISTFAGYIPIADGFNLEHLPRYPQDNLLTDVHETWWLQIVEQLDAKLGINDSWRGATVSGAAPVTTGTTGENAAMHNLIRIQNLGSNGTPDVILFYGGTNDLAHVSKVGTFDAQTAPASVDLTTKKWDNLADGYVHTLLRLKYYYPDAQIVCLLPTYTTSYYSNTKLAEANAVLSAICEYYQVPYVDLRDCGIITADLPDGIHPDAQGMDYITQAVIDLLMDTCCVEQGANVVHSVKHTLTDAKSSASYYKGISHGKSFTANITGKNVTVQVTMGGEDITASCYSNGTVNIPTVTGDVVIVATGEKQLIYAEYLQQLPEQYCENTNLWQILAHDKEYYSASGWAVHSSGNVYSVTLPVVPGDQLWATSMGGAGKNGSNINGIRVTWFDANGVLQSMPADQVYAEFSANGYLTAPNGAVAVNIPMWTVSDANELYILSAEHDYTASVTLPTGREKGYVTHNCASCDDYYSVDWLPDDTYEGMTLVCVGDSITAGIGASAKGETDYVTLLSQALGMEYINLGASGTTLCTDGHRTCNIGQLTESKLRDADIVLIMMGINDFDQAKAGYYALGDIDSTDSSTIYGAARMWCERIAELKQTEQYKDTQFYFVTPCITSWNDSVTSQKNWDQSKTTIHGYTLRDLCNAIIDVAALYEISTIDMNLLSGMYYVDAEHNNVAEFGGDGVHFGDRGHEMVSEAFVKFLLQKDLNTDHDHTFGEWIITVYPTCRTGKESRVCTACSYAESRELDVKHDYDAIVTAPTCTEQGYTTYTCVCGDSYVDSYVDIIWHTYADGTCSNCGCDMIRVTLDDIIRYQGGVDSETGKINITFTNNWYTNISIPQNAEQVRVLTFKTYGAWGSAFLNDAGTFISGHCDKTVGGEWITLDVPADATVFRYGYLYDQIAQNNGFPTFEYLEFAGTDLQEAEQSPYMPRPETGCHAFSVDVNIAPAKGDPDGYEKGTDYGYIQLPANYDPYGEPVRLIIVCHGAGAELATYQSDAWKNTNYSFWTDLGYAVMDMYACPPELSKDNSALHYGNPVVLECYKAGYQYVMKHFNLKQDGIYLVGSSMGGLSSFQIAQSEEFPVIAQVAYCPVIDLFKQAYCNPWTTPSYQRSRIAQYFGFTGTAPTYTNSKHPSAQEIAYFEQNLDKTLRYSPILSNVLLGDPTTIFEVIPNSATATDAQEQAIYDKLTATHPNPLMIFHNLDDTTVSYRYSKYFVDMLKRSGQDAMLYTFETGGHNAWANGESYEVQGITRTITIKESQYQAYLFFSRFEQHEEHCEWVDPAIEPTCTQSGKTQGSHCAVCGEVLIAQQQVDALGHDMDESGSCSVCGYHEYIVGDVNNDEIVNRQDAIYLLYHVLLGNKRYPVNQPVDFNGDGNITRADAIYLLYHVLLPSKYPLS